MTRPEAVRYYLTPRTMAFPRGRLLATRQGRLLVLAADGWVTLGRHLPSGVEPLTRERAEQWCRREEIDPAWLDAVPTPTR
ncbi:hypothetical protein [Streptoalloteichus tenebrarius]|uniref:hypothetical protein n=1 Tax=Streptoalloteichus tenebrarius (strain ATCC 17920 / DSM 40477 / JCM 4838 / CBS 697.72 / NBRC 16177 / NCIMB 11028 / NRRL B-12390 / A12253. 1 / ISP 5477) TaxID=1933 RepID=UPI0020A38AB9|nr:hypothetical protein [Streptoalloteichus tenebrarius]